MVEVTGSGEVVDRGGVVSTDGSGDVQRTDAPTQGSVKVGDANTTGRQDWWPEGVNTPEELQAYVENLNKPAEGKAPEAPAEEDPNAPKPAEEAPKPGARTDEEIRASLKEAGGIYADPRYEPLALSFEKNGTLTPEEITTAAASFGVSEDAVKAFVDGQVAQRELAATKATQTATAAQQQMATAIVKIVPDNAAYEAIVGPWGKENLSATEAKAYDSAMDRGDVGTVEALLNSFYAKYQAQGNGLGRREIATEAAAGGNPQGGESAAVQPFASQAEAVKAIGSAQYRNDAKFRASVDARYAVSSFKGGR